MDAQMHQKRKKNEIGDKMKRSKWVEANRRGTVSEMKADFFFFKDTSEILSTN